MKLAVICYVRKDGQVLMTHRNKKEGDYHKGKWNGLGGKFEAGESPEECARREIKEESGLIAEELKFRGFITFPLFDGVEDWHVFLFTVDKFSGSLTESPEGDLEWIPQDKIFDLNLWEGDKTFLSWIFEEKFFTAKFNYKNGKFIDYSANFY